MIKYDFSNLLEACELVISNPERASSYQNLRKELNKFFKDSKCTDIIYTRNDSLFFGMCVYPVVSTLDVQMIVQDDGKYRFKNYVIEIDSKIFNPIIDITPNELLAMLLHEVGHIINDPNPVEQVRDAINVSLAKENTTLSIVDTVQYYQILAYGIKNTVRKMNSMFFIYRDGEVLADEFVMMCGFQDELNNVFRKLCKNGMKVNDDVNKLAALTWTLNLYKNVELRRIPALKLLRRASSITSSKLDKKEYEIVANALKSIDTSAIKEAAKPFKDCDFYYVLVQEGASLKKKDTKFAILRKMVTNNKLRDFESDVYEYTLRSRHVATEEDALYLMRQINLRITAIEDALNKERFDEYERDRWFALHDKYCSLRAEMAANTKYRYDYSGSVITVQYPEIVENRY
jgi:hypothetical protein